jgi:hypothetical protein
MRIAITFGKYRQRFDCSGAYWTMHAKSSSCVRPVHVGLDAEDVAEVEPLAQPGHFGAAEAAVGQPSAEDGVHSSLLAHGPPLDEEGTPPVPDSGGAEPIAWDRPSTAAASVTVLKKAARIEGRRSRKEPRGLSLTR